MNNARRPLVCGNWKMYAGGTAGLSLASAVAKVAKDHPKVDLAIAPPFTVLSAAAYECAETPLALCGQNLHPKPEGAYTGEISGPMLKEAGCKYVLVGHSERRQSFGETDELVADKVRAALACGLHPIVCVGETLAERELGKTLDVVLRQVNAVLPILAGGAGATLAYEPVWAIGTGRNAGPSEAEEVHKAIRETLHEVSLSEKIRILYGGSVKPENAEALLSCPNVDGALVGGASLDAASFGAIATVASRLTP